MRMKIYRLAEQRRCPGWRCPGAAAAGLLLLMLANANSTAAADAGPTVDTNNADSELSEITVTAQRRSENLQRVPVTVDAFGAASLESNGVESLTELGTVEPGLIFSTVAGYALPYLRGVGTAATGPGFENPIAINVDGVYYAAQAGSILSLNNIESIEVDKGPQGTLFGRNATGGAIQITTKTPSQEFGGSISAGYGNYNTTTGDFYVTGPISSNVAADLAVDISHQGTGYGTILDNGQPLERNRDYAARSKWLLTPTADTRITIIGDYSETQTIPALLPAPGTLPLGGPPPASNPRDAYGIGEPFANVRQWGLSVTASQQLSFGKVESITAYRDTYFHSYFDNTLTDNQALSFWIDIPEPHKQASEELHLLSKESDTFNWIVGAYYFFERSGFGVPTYVGGGLIGPSPVVLASDLTTDAMAAFAQGTYKVADGTHLTLGFRENDEKRYISTAQWLQDLTTGAKLGFASATGSQTYTSPTWRLILDHDFSSDFMAYASYNRGFKSGGFNSGTFPASTFKPEKLDAYELGLKSQFLDRRLRLNLAGFYYNYSDIQTGSYPNGVLVVVNGAKAHIYGLDLDAEFAVTQGLRISGGLEALHATYAQFDNAPLTLPAPGGGTIYTTGSATGNDLPKAPPVTFNIGANYTRDLSFARFKADVIYSFNDGWYSDPDNRLRQPSYSLVNASAGLETLSSGLEVRFWGKNLLNKLYAETLAAQSPSDFVQWAPPRTYGFTVTKKF